MYFSLFVGVLCLSLFCYALLCAHSSFAIILKRKRKPVALPLLSYFCGSFMGFFVLCLLCLCARLFIWALWSAARKELTSWLSFVVSNCEFVTFPLVSWVRCGTWLYWFLIFAPLFTLHRYCYYKCSVALPHSAMGWFAVCDCGNSWSYSLFYSLEVLLYFIVQR